MIEVFKTDVSNQDHARMLVDRIHKAFKYCRANFDLQDCDKILRVTGVAGEEEIWQIVTIVRSFGWQIEVLNDEASFEGHELLHERFLIDKT